MKLLSAVVLLLCLCEAFAMKTGDESGLKTLKRLLDAIEEEEKRNALRAQAEAELTISKKDFDRLHDAVHDLNDLLGKLGGAEKKSFNWVFYYETKEELKVGVQVDMESDQDCAIGNDYNMCKFMVTMEDLTDSSYNAEMEVTYKKRFGYFTVPPNHDVKVTSKRITNDVSNERPITRCYTTKETGGVDEISCY